MSEIVSDTRLEILQHLSGALAAAEPIGLPALICLIEIALNEGLSVSELAERTGAPQQSVSRYVSLLLGRYQSSAMDVPIDPLIVQRINSADPRKRSLHVTEAGSRLIEGLTRPVFAEGMNVSG